MTQILRDINEIEALVTAVVATQKQNDDNIQTALCSLAVHLHEHKNTTVVNKIIGELDGSGVRGNAIKQFCEMFMPVRWDSKKKAMAFAGKKLVENFEESEKFATMIATRWTTLKPDAPYRGFDMETKLESLVRAATRHLDDKEQLSDEDKEKLVVDQTEIDMVNAFLANLRQHRNDKKAAIVAAAIQEQGE